MSNRKVRKQRKDLVVNTADKPNNNGFTFFDDGDSEFDYDPQRAGQEPTPEVANASDSPDKKGGLRGRLSLPSGRRKDDPVKEDASQPRTAEPKMADATRAESGAAESKTAEPEMTEPEMTEPEMAKAEKVDAAPATPPPPTAENYIDSGDIDIESRLDPQLERKPAPVEAVAQSVEKTGPTPTELLNQLIEDEEASGEAMPALATQDPFDLAASPFSEDATPITPQRIEPHRHTKPVRQPARERRQPMRQEAFGNLSDPFAPASSPVEPEPIAYVQPEPELVTYDQPEPEPDLVTYDQPEADPELVTYDQPQPEPEPDLVTYDQPEPVAPAPAVAEPSLVSATGSRGAPDPDPARADTDSGGNWIPPLLRGMAPVAEREGSPLPKRRSED